MSPANPVDPAKPADRPDSAVPAASELPARAPAPPALPEPRKRLDVRRTEARRTDAARADPARERMPPAEPVGADAGTAEAVGDPPAATVTPAHDGDGSPRAELAQAMHIRDFTDIAPYDWATLSGPVHGHPERVIGYVPLTPAERGLWAQLVDLPYR